MSKVNCCTEAEHAHRLAYALRAVMVSLEVTNAMGNVSDALRGIVAHTLSDYFTDDHSELTNAGNSTGTNG